MKIIDKTHVTFYNRYLTDPDAPLCISQNCFPDLSPAKSNVLSTQIFLNVILHGETAGHPRRATWTYAEYAQAERRLVRRGTPWPDREQYVYIMDTPYQRRLYEVVVGRKRLDEIIKEECGEQE